MSTTDSISLSTIRCYGYTGYLPEEQVLGQWFEVDITLWLDLAKAGQSDRIEDTLDYRAVIQTVKDLIKTSKYALIERLADTIAQAILALPSPIPLEKVRIRLTKPGAPIPDFGGQITLEITRP